jgi:cytochrome c553
MKLIPLMTSLALGIISTNLYAGDVEAGKKLSEKYICASCHGPDLKHPIAPNYPKIAGQHEDYLYYALKSYKVDNHSQVGRGNAIMGGQAKQLTLAEMKDLAAYVASLPGDLVVKK